MSDIGLLEELVGQSLKTEKYTLDGEYYLAKCVKCYDADTIHIVIKLNQKFTRFVCRLQKIDTPELRTKCLKEKAAAKSARDYLKGLILDQIILVKCGPFDKYGRLLVDVFSQPQLGGGHHFTIGSSKIDNNDNNINNDYLWENSINKILIDIGHAYPYDGGKKQPFSQWGGKNLNNLDEQDHTPI